MLYNFVPSSYKWEIQPRSASFLSGLYHTFKEDRKALETVAPEDAITMGLYFAVKAATGDTNHQQVVRKILEIAANQHTRIALQNGSNAYQKTYHNAVACDLVSRLCETLGGFHDREDATKWLKAAVDTGSIYARVGLRELDPEGLSKTLESFYSRGGYTMLYRDIVQPPSASLSLGMKGIADQNMLHELSAFGSYKDLEAYLDEHPDLLINAKSEREETALYVACVRGSWEHAALLLRKGSDPSIKCTPSGISCVHWTFAFEGKTCGISVREMLRAGADINVLIPPNVELPFPHYPFVLPSGTPLHWAVATSSHHAIKVLIDAGADPLMRNGSDPYVYDDRIRHLYAVGGPDAEGCTFPESGCLGLSAVDLAAVHRDPYLLRLMVERGVYVDINSADEEGFTVLHRLATSQIFRTSRRVRYPAHMFRGTDQAGSLQALIVAIQSLGGDIERLTSSAEAAIQKIQRCTDLEKFSYTPLMLAILEGDHGLVLALLECGASVNTENASRTTALFHISHRANAEQPQLLHCFQTLFTHRANIYHCSSNGNTPLLAAAKGQVYDIFDFLLSQGAHIDERDRTERSALPGKSVFAFFASFDNSSDGILLQLLTKYVFHSSEPQKKRRVVQDGSDHGSTLLHECARFAMPNCTKALLWNGARVNALERKIPFGKHDGRSISYETPLDRLKSTRDFTLKMILQRNTISPNQSKILQARWREVEKHLQSEGGKYWTPDMTCE
jgi:ankyrin repeat protein